MTSNLGTKPKKVINEVIEEEEEEKNNLVVSINNNNNKEKTNFINPLEEFTKIRKNINIKCKDKEQNQTEPNSNLNNLNLNTSNGNKNKITINNKIKISPINLNNIDNNNNYTNQGNKTNKNLFNSSNTLKQTLEKNLYLSSKWNQSTFSNGNNNNLIFSTNTITNPNLNNLNTFSNNNKLITIRDRTCADNKNTSKKGGVFLPELTNAQKSSADTEIKNDEANQINNIKSQFKPGTQEKIKEILTPTSMGCGNKRFFRGINNMYGPDTPSTSAFTNSSKKYSSSNNKDKMNNLTEDYSKFRSGLLSAGSGPGTTNVIIPLIPMRRPVSNFNFGGGQLWQNTDRCETDAMGQSNLNFLNNEDVNLLKENFNDRGKLNPLREKIQIIPISRKNSNSSNKNRVAKSQDIKGKFLNPINQMSTGEILPCPKLHKIKIEKGMTTKIADNLTKKSFAEYQNYLHQFKKNQLLIMFNGGAGIGNKLYTNQNYNFNMLGNNKHRGQSSGKGY